MKLWHLTGVFVLAVLSGWWLNRQNPAAANVVRARAPSALAHIHFAGDGPSRTITAAVEGTPEEIVRLPHSVPEFIAELARLNACYSGRCDYPQTDPRSYELAVGQDLKKMLLEMSDWAQAEGLERREISHIARKFLASDDGYVQAAALDLLSTQPPTRDNLDAILANILAGYDSELIEHAMLELERYTSADDGDRIDQALGDALTMGAPFVAREISSHITPFVNDRSFRFFQDVAERLPPQSFYRLHLESSLAEFRGKKTSG